MPEAPDMKPRTADSLSRSLDRPSENAHNIGRMQRKEYYCAIAPAVAVPAALYFPPNLAAVSTIGTILIVLLLAPRLRPFTVVVLAAVPYALGAWIGAGFGIRFYPYPGLAGYWAASREQLIGLLILQIVGMVSGIAVAFGQRFTSAALAMRGAHCSSMLATTIAASVAILIGCVDLGTVALNWGTIASSSRHVVSGEFIAGNGLIGIILAVGLSGILLADVTMTHRRTRLSLSAFCIMWIPTLLAGGRNYASVSIVVGLTLFFFSRASRTAKRRVGVLSLVGAILFLMLPTLWSTNPAIGFNEWILPNTLFLAIYHRMYSLELSGVTPFIEQWQLLLPGFLRSRDIVLYSNWFGEIGRTNVSVGGSPWAEFDHPDGRVRVALFTAITLALIVAAIVLTRVNPLAPYFCIGLMFFWGRSLFWGSLILLLALTAFTALSFRSRTTQESTPRVSSTKC